MSRLIGVAIAGVLLAGCKGRGTAESRDGGTLVPGTATAPGPAPAPAPAPAHALASAPCRIIALTGHALGEAGPLLLQGDVPPGWLSLPDGAHLVGKDPRTARETTFDGPGRVRDCVASAEEAWVAEGSFESTAGAGEAPGAEQWVVTPHAVVRYASAKVRLRVSPTGTTVTMVAGVAFAWPPAARSTDAGAPTPLEEGWQRLGAGSTVLGPSGGTGDAVARCTDLARRTRNLTAALFGGGGEGGAPTGTTVTDQVTTRRLARAACAIGHLRVDTEPGAPSEKLGTELGAGDQAWRTLPVPSAATAQ